MKSDRSENPSLEALEFAMGYTGLPPEGQRELDALMGAHCRNADPDAIDVIIEQRKRGDVTGLETMKKLEALPGRLSCARISTSTKQHCT